MVLIPMKRPLPNHMTADVGHMIITCTCNMDLEQDARGTKRHQTSLLSYTSKRQKEDTRLDDLSLQQSQGESQKIILGQASHIKNSVVICSSSQFFTQSDTFSLCINTMEEDLFFVIICF